LETTATNQVVGNLMSLGDWMDVRDGSKEGIEEV
jgi:hypothetical protein